MERKYTHLIRSSGHSLPKMEGEAMLWFHSWCQEDLRGDWESFSQTMRRFGVSYDSMILDSMRL
jgi:hypothetical protein